MTETPVFENCGQVMDYICGHFGEDDDSPRCRTLRSHLSHCPDCTSYCDSMEKMIGLFRAASPDFPAQARTVLLEVLGIEHPGPQPA
jgi:hypothetical protein